MRVRHFLSLLLLASIILVFVYGMYWRATRYNEPAKIDPVILSATSSYSTTKETGVGVAYFAGGCFWCVESNFEKFPGVIEGVSGYSGGHLVNPKYTDVITETTGHRETVEVRYDPEQVNYQRLVEYFFSTIDPTDAGGQFIDRGESYTSAIFPRTMEERAIIENEIMRLTRARAYDTTIVTRVLPFEKFWPAEEYHQDYYKKNSLRYTYYRSGSGRDQRVNELCDVRSIRKVPCLTTQDQ